MSFGLNNTQKKFESDRPNPVASTGPFVKLQGQNRQKRYISNFTANNPILLPLKMWGINMFILVVREVFA